MIMMMVVPTHGRNRQSNVTGGRVDGSLFHGLQNVVRRRSISRFKTRLQAGAIGTPFLRPALSFHNVQDFQDTFPLIVRDAQSQYRITIGLFFAIVL
jgi:hypothetical protein